MEYVKSEAHNTCWLVILATEQLIDANIKFHPNPVTEHLIIEDPDQKLQGVKIFNSHGQLLYTGDDLLISTMSFMPGIYMVEFTLTNGAVVTEKISRL